MSTTVLDQRFVRTAEELRNWLNEMDITDGGLDSIYLRDSIGVDSVMFSLIEDTLSDGSTVLDMKVG